MYDILIIGSGPGGYVAAIRAAQLGFKTAVVERSELGGICLNWGCIPTKALLKSAQVYNYSKHIADYGIAMEGTAVPDIGKVTARSRAVSAGMAKGVEYLFKKNNITVLQGHGRLNADKAVTVKANDGTEQTVSAKHIVIATGARANSLPFAPIDGKKIIAYRDALVPSKIPATMAIIGSGAIGSEFAYFYQTMGTQVTLIEYLENVAPLEDEETSAQISRSFRKMGMKIMLGAQVKAVDTSGEGCVLTVQTKKGEESLQAELVLSAVGVVPNTENIGLEAAGVAIERGRIKVDEWYKTNVEGVYAIGDVIATPALAHIASAEAIACIEKIAGLDAQPVRYDNFPSCIYVSPEVASTGLTEKAARAKGLEIKVGKFPFTASGKASAAGEKDGFVKLIFDARTDELIGAHLCGANVSEMIGGIVTARNLGVKGKDIIHSVFPHPSMSEAIMEAAAAAHGEVIHL